MPKIPPMPVTVANAIQVPWQTRIQGIGSFVAIQSVKIRSGIPGHIKRINFKSGQSVSKDQLIVVIDHKVLDAQLAEAKAQLVSSRLNYQRSKRLIKTKSISLSELDNSQATFEADQARVAQIQAELDDAFVKTPFPGHLGLRHISLGDYVNADTELVSLKSLDPIYVDFNVPARYLSFIKKGQVFQVEASGQPHRLFNGKILAFDASVDPDTRNLTVRGVVSNPDGKLIPGGLTEVTLLYRHTNPVITLPQEAVIKSDDKDVVYVVVKGKAFKKAVQVVQRNASTVLVSSGLKPGDKVVMAGQIKLREGAPVVILNEPQTSRHP